MLPIAAHGVCCLIGLKTPDVSLFKLECMRDSKRKPPFCVCSRAVGQVYAGDSHNPATFWATRYLSMDDPERMWSIDEALALAVQIVVDASQINNGSIRGLEIVRGNSEGFRQVTVKDCKAWAAEAIKRSRYIEKLVTSPLP